MSGWKGRGMGVLFGVQYGSECHCGVCVSTSIVCHPPKQAGLGSGQPQGLGVVHNVGPYVSMGFVSGHQCVSL